jgi:hypothetical protein
MLLVGLSAYVIAQALAMSRPRGWSSAPGLVPLLLGVSLLLMALALSVGAARAGGWARVRSQVPGARQAAATLRNGGWRAPFLLTCLAVYVYVLLARLPFEVATFLYLSVVLGTLWRRGLLTVLLVSGGVAVIVTLLFERFLRTLLPGSGSLL